MPVYTDTHAHLDLPDYADDLDAVLRNAGRCGVGRIICAGTSLESTRRCIGLASQFPGLITAAAGIHPGCCSPLPGDAIKQLRTLAASPEVVAIGETGLDFHRDYRDRQLQKDFFRRHIEIALELDKPLIIHGRKADEEILAVLDSYDGPISGVRHCFDGSEQIAALYAERGFYLAFGGLITRQGYKKPKKAARSTPPDRLLIETDCPYMTPAGAPSRRNQPAYISLTVEALAELRNETTERIAAVTTENAKTLGLWGEDVKL